MRSRPWRSCVSDPLGPNRIVNYRPLLFAALGLAGGILLFEELRRVTGATALFYGLLIVLEAGAVTCAVLLKPKPLKLLAVFVAIGMARTLIAVPFAVCEGEADVVGTVEGVSETKEGVVTLRRVYVDGERFNAKVRLTLTAGNTPAIGDTIAARASVREPSIRFGTYDERLIFLADGVGCAAKAGEYRLLGSGALPILKLSNDARRFLLSRSEEIFGSSSGIVSGFLFGAKQGVDEADTESFRATGTAHLLSLSGFHVALLTYVIFLLVPKRAPRARFAFGCAFLLFYCFIAGFSPSIVRAGVACACALLAAVLERRPDPLSALSASAILILLVSPYKLYSVGFELSYAATLGILFMVSTGFRRRGIGGKLLSDMLVTFGATAATLLISARYFGTVCVYSLVANIAAVPIFSAAIVLSFILMLIGIPFPGAAAVLSFIPNTLTEASLSLLRIIESIPYSVIGVGRPSAISIVLMLLILFFASGYVLRPPKRKLAICGSLLVVFAASCAADVLFYGSF